MVRTAKSAPYLGNVGYKDQRDYELLPKRIEELEAAIARDEAKLADPDLYAKDPGQFDRLMKAIEKARGEKDEAEMRWLELAEQVEALAGGYAPARLLGDACGRHGVLEQRGHGGRNVLIGRHLGVEAG